MAIITGNNDANTLFGDVNGAAEDDAISGLGGNDQLNGLGGNDTLDGGDGDDLLLGGAGADILRGGDGIDTISYEGSTGGIVLDSHLHDGVIVNLVTGTAQGGHAAGDTFSLIENITGSSFGDYLLAGAGNNVLDGGDGNDSLRGGAGADILNGGNGIDEIEYDDSTVGVTINLETGFASGGSATGDSFSSIEEADGSNFDDVLIGSSGANELDGLKGDDTLDGGGGDDLLRGFDGNDTLSGGAGNDTLIGAAGADTLNGGTGNDIYYIANAGDTVLEVFAEGTDRVISSVSYTLTDNVENLTLNGTSAVSGTGNGLGNNIVGNSAANTLSGGAGNDMLNGGAGADTLNGGTGNDVYYIDNAGDVVTEAAGEGTDTVRASIAVTLGSDVEHLVLTGAAAISGTGNALANSMTGNAAANTLRGEGGADVLNGGGGDDRLYGGVGNDRLTGGAGSDNFYFDTALSGTLNVDKILDFSSADDSIYLERSIFAGISANGTLSAAGFRLGTAAGDADDRIIYDSVTGKIYYDADGDGAGAKVLFAQVAAGTTLTNADFVGLTATTTTSRTTSIDKDSSYEWQAADFFSFESETLLSGGEFAEPARMLDQQQWSQMQQIHRLDWNSFDYFSS